MRLALCLRSWWLLLSMVVLAGCATAPKPSEPIDDVNGPWAGRLALQVEDKPGDSFSAGFELKGAARAGELTLYSPLGGVFAVLSWEPGSATLRSNGDTRQFASVDALVSHATGAPLPVTALFDWLRGVDTRVAGWQADLSALGQGRLVARRHEPVPKADLRVVLER
jgi:outer membrane lipoprotein LolB